ncbi:SNF2 family N-terminal domain-containing protein [Microdochium trichocladiopsis]|uniref:Chromatin-remodeling ATPase INO80 n=1 Tax=Microdochium trichocladiopsis TaxID=1682393 RepID=A0A9P9BRH8_9PEZI|nr:SNF2 family N-terminal domain-containing protein [Microdochium trichocladiopsis]KAH7032743.1 SNF2 family N-terminal domain-containing protein [Microdochium trichocladiopsis]
MSQPPVAAGKQAGAQPAADEKPRIGHSAIDGRRGSDPKSRTGGGGGVVVDEGEELQGRARPRACAAAGAPTPSATSHLEHASTLLGLNRRQPSSAHAVARAPSAPQPPRADSSTSSPLQPHLHPQHLSHRHLQQHRHQHHPSAIAASSPAIPPSSPAASSSPPDPASPAFSATRPQPPPPASHHPHASSNLPLRSPSTYRHPFYPSPSHDSQPGSSSLAAPPGALSSIMASTNGSGAGTGGSLRPPSGSPLQAPQGAGHLSPPAPYNPTTRDKSSGSFYDPLTDTTRERKPSDSWSKPSRPDPYDYTERKPDYGRYHNGYGSPVATHPKPAPTSPVALSHPRNGDPISPSHKALQLGSPTARHRTTHDAIVAAPRHTPAPSLPSLLNPEPVPAPAPSSTPSRAAELMSFSNILSSGPDPVPKAKAPIIPEPKDKPPRKSKGRESRVRDSVGASSRRSSSVNPPKEPGSRAQKRQANGQPKPKMLSADKEKKIQNYLDSFDATMDDLDLSDLENEYQMYSSSAKKRKLNIGKKEHEDHIARRAELSAQFNRRLRPHITAGKRRFDELHYEDALQEVREREVFAEKERKKDMQRKRRREKSMQVTIEQKEAALARALAAEDDAERAKHLRDAERANKKAQQTKLILQKGIKGPARNLGGSDLNLEGGIMSSFQVSDMETGSARKGKGRAGARPKKSKQQKQAEKDSAEAAQAALDAGEELPTREETTKIRIKLSKNKDKLKEKREEDDDEGTATELTVKEKKRKKKDDQPPVDPLEMRYQSKGYNQIYDQIWRDMARKDVTKTYKLAADSYATKASNLKKTAILASKEAKRWQLRTNKGTKDLQARAKRCMRDMMGFWKRNEREERDLRKAAEKQELENARREEADREAARQKRKLNFLISQTELYSHFIGKKIKTDEVERSTDNPEIAASAAPTAEHGAKLNVEEPTGPVGSKVTDFNSLNFDEADEDALKAAAIANAQNAIAEAQQKARAFNKSDADMDEDGEMNFQNPTGLGDATVEQPKLLNCQLKEYQLKGLNWLANLYEQGINGILADEMGLGKTVQSISVMAYLAEVHDIWGPYLVVAPASTLHNWQQEIAKFVPEFKVLPYWGTAGDRKVLRKFWDRKHATYKKDAPFHVMVTSYQLVVSDVAYFQKMRWQYMILDEAQAIKSSQSSRWKVLLSFHCRNRLLLTGTPIQNNMQELWALLHFIMPSLFDSHDEFSEWFSKDIESHAQSNTTLNEDQLKRLHMILKPFMLRRVKKHVQKELGDKIELDVYCNLTYRQRAMYKNLRNQISIMELIEKATMGDEQDSGTLTNLVMQFRKVCNHPDLFERADVTSPYYSGYFAETASFVREGNDVLVGYSTRNSIEYNVPRLVWNQDGRVQKPTRSNAKAGFRNKYLDHMMNIWSPDNVRDSTTGKDAFSFLRFADASIGEVHKAGQQDVFTRAASLATKNDRLSHLQIVYDEEEDKNFTPAHAMFQITARSNRKPLADITKEGVLANLMNVARSEWDNTGLGRLEQAARPKAAAAPIDISCDGTSAPEKERQETLFNVPFRRALFGPNTVEEKALVNQKIPVERYPLPALYPKPDNDKRKFTDIAVPSMQRFVTDCGKLAKLDQLLFKLKEEGHRVLLYFQMTRMIDMIEEYLTYRNYKYCRLDGSTKLEDRRDTVADFQSRPEIFIFLLSTRAGGLGINLTSADTVIFYDSDWNPTIDSQAMDRAHRLGQTRQVTVYRLITRGTIEERIRKRAMQKEEVQRVVIQGGGARGVDFSGRRPTENRNREIAMWLADDEQAELIEQRERELAEQQSKAPEKPTKKKAASKKKREAVSLDEMYHEGEGHFDDGNKPSGTATPVPAEDETATKGGPGPKKRKAGSKKAKTIKERLKVADGDV